MAGGRPTIKTPELVEAILADLRKGLPRRTAAALHVAPDTFYRWLNEDAEFSDAVVIQKYLDVIAGFRKAS